MENNTVLYVRVFDGFEITNQFTTLTYENIRSDKVVKLFLYLIFHHQQPISVQEIADVLWQNEDIDNPIGALKNLVYRLRNLLKQNFNISNCIITGRGSYTWNQDISVISDMSRMDAIAKEIKTIENIDDQKNLYQEAMTIYRGPFMPNLVQEHWTISISTYYHSLFLSLVKEYCLLLEKLGDFKMIEDICNHAIAIDSLDETLHYWFIKSLTYQGKQKLAMDHYKATTKMLYDSLGTKPSKELEDFYHELQHIVNDQEKDLFTIQQELQVPIDGALICEYGTFKDIYQLQARLAKRLGVSIYMALITVIPVLNFHKSEAQALTKAMNTVLDILKTSLRKGDTIARYSTSQYVILLPTCTYETATKVMQRTLSKFYVGVKNRGIDVQYNLQELILSPEKEVKYEKK